MSRRGRDFSGPPMNVVDGSLKTRSISLSSENQDVWTIETWKVIMMDIGQPVVNVIPSCCCSCVSYVENLSDQLIQMMKNIVRFKKKKKNRSGVSSRDLSRKYNNI